MVKTRWFWHHGALGAPGQWRAWTAQVYPVELKELRLRSAAAVLALLSCAAAGCRHQPEPASAWVPPGQAAPELALAPTKLADDAALLRLVEAYSLTGAEAEGLQVLLQTAKDLPKARLQADPVARKLVALAVYRTVRGANLGERFDAIRALVDALQAASPDAPETIFCRAFLRFVLLQDDGKRLQPGTLDRSIVMDLDRDLGALTDKHPQFDGPGDWPHERILYERQRVAQMLTALPLAGAATPSEAPSAATATAP